VKAKDLIDGMVQQGMGPFTGVPCSVLKDAINYIEMRHSECYLTANNEGEALAIASGMYLAGKRPVVLMQNSGIGNMINPFVSLNQIYKIPITFVISWRGYTGISDAVQHEYMGKITSKILELIGINIIDLTQYDFTVEEILQRLENNYQSKKSSCILINRATLEKEEISNDSMISMEMSTGISKADVVEALVSITDDSTAIVSSTGVISRELHNFADRNLNFYMVGSMGCTLSIGMGLASESDKKIVVLEGDGSVLMRMESLATVGTMKPDNLVHIVLIDKLYETTGGQQTNNIAFDEVIKGCGCQKIYKCYEKDNLHNSLRKVLENREYSTLLVYIGKKTEVKPRISRTPETIRETFMTSLREEQ
jgi:phosphonopyruvate decarboxylase